MGSRRATPDAVVVGSGPNGLVAANVLADAGWSVLVLEANAEFGGAVRTAEVTAPGFRNDLFSAFYPLTAASPVMAELGLEQFGLAWTHAPKVLAHPRDDGPAAILSRDLAVTAASLERGAAGDGDRYIDVFERWQRISGPLMGSLLRPFPPIRNAARLIAAARLRGTAELARLAVLPVRNMMAEEFAGEAAWLLFAGNALHADLTPDASGSGLFGWMLVGLGQQYGFPVPIGGAGAITAALVARARDRGVELVAGQRVERIDIDDRRVTGVTTSDGTRLPCTIALADCEVQTLMLQMVGSEHLPARYVQRIHRVQRSAATFKVDWALSAPVPWTDPDVVGAGTVHIAGSADELTMTAAQLAMNQVPAKPFVLIGQMTTADATRSPDGTEAMWAYTHVPQHPTSDAGCDGITGAWRDADTDAFVHRIERRIEALAPGFTSRIVARHVMSPRDLEHADRNLVGGDIGGGTAQLHQQLIFRPTTGLGRAETPIRGLYLASASAHPGGAVHGACGANAARAALLHHPARRARRALERSSGRHTSMEDPT